MSLLMCLCVCASVSVNYGLNFKQNIKPNRTELRRNKIKNHQQIDDVQSLSSSSLENCTSNIKNRKTKGATICLRIFFSSCLLSQPHIDLLWLLLFCFQIIIMIKYIRAMRIIRKFKPFFSTIIHLLCYMGFSDGCKKKRKDNDGHHHYHHRHHNDQRQW